MNYWKSNAKDEGSQQNANKHFNEQISISA